MPVDKDLKMALAYAADEASLDQQSAIDTDHLLRGLLRFPNEACTVLNAIQLDLAMAREASKRRQAGLPRDTLPLSTPIRKDTLPALSMVARPFLTVGLLALAQILVLLLLGWLK
jgi:ATP-dependent Clp protease ATP-binding subunit ClpA